VRKRTLVNAPLYTTDILRLAASLPLENSLFEPHGRAERRSRACGSMVTAEVKLGSDGRIERLAQRVQACAFGQASAALVQGFAAGRSLEELTAAQERMARWLGGEGEAPETFDVLSPARTKIGRHGAMLLPFDAVIAAVEEATTPLDFARDERTSCGSEEA
jgi:NifU-like protein involved in Fe-S cluster formation